MRDQGMGIPESSKSAIFEQEFRKPPEEKPKHAGSAGGLSMGKLLGIIAVLLFVLVAIVIAINLLPPQPPLTNCNENWNCTEWSACSNGTQSRSCSDSSNCGTIELKPAEERDCQLPADSDYCAAASECGGKGLAHAECVGAWACESKKCAWNCEIVPPVGTSGKIINLNFGQSVEVAGLNFEVYKAEIAQEMLSGFGGSIKLNSPGDGKEYFTVWAKITNNGAKNANIQASNFSSSDSLGNKYGLGLNIRFDGMNSRAGRIEPGRNVSGTLTWEVPVAVDSLKVEFDLLNIETDKEKIVWAVPVSAASLRECTGFSGAKYLAHNFLESGEEFQIALQNASGGTWLNYSIYFDSNVSPTSVNRTDVRMNKSDTVIAHANLNKSVVAGNQITVHLDYNSTESIVTSETAQCTYST
ncbi:MAG: DUF4352 domain-containing protein [Candidatus Diapherotrites archaeon]